MKYIVIVLIIIGVLLVKEDVEEIKDTQLFVCQTQNYLDESILSDTPEENEDNIETFTTYINKQK